MPEETLQLRERNVASKMVKALAQLVALQNNEQGLSYAGQQRLQLKMSQCSLLLENADSTFASALLSQLATQTTF